MHKKYLDNVTVCGKTQAGHNNNLARFMSADVDN